MRTRERRREKRERRETEREGEEKGREEKRRTFEGEGRDFIVLSGILVGKNLPIV